MENRKLKRLFYDIETSPNIVYSWNIGYNLNIGHDNIIKERAVICICYKWEGDKEVHSLHWDKGNDKEMIYKFFDVINEADEVIGHNSDSFDTKWFNTRALFHGIKTIKEFRSIDTYKASKKRFRFNSNRLDYISKFLGFKGKTDTGGFDLWKQVMDGNQESLQKMINYCKNDVIILEKVFNKLDGYIKPKTHLGVLQSKSKCSCPKCASNKYVVRGTIVTSAGIMKKELQCKSCNYTYIVSLQDYVRDIE